MGLFIKPVLFFLVLFITAKTGKTHDCDVSACLGDDPQSTYNITEECLIRGNHTQAQKEVDHCVLNKLMSCHETDNLVDFLSLQVLDISGYNVTLEKGYEVYCESMLDGCSFESCLPQVLINDPGIPFFEQVANALPVMMLYCGGLDCVDSKAPTCPERTKLTHIALMNTMISIVPGISNMASSERDFYKKLIRDTCPKYKKIQTQEDCIKTKITNEGFQDCVKLYNTTFGTGNPTSCENYNAVVYCVDSHVRTCHNEAVEGVLVAARFLDSKLPRDCPTDGAPRLAVSFGLLLALLVYRLL